MIAALSLRALPAGSCSCVQLCRNAHAETCAAERFVAVCHQAGACSTMRRAGVMLPRVLRRRSKLVLLARRNGMLPGAW